MTDIHQVKLDSSVDITVVESLYGEFEKVLSSNGGVAIDAGQVERIDTSALQLIFTFKEQINSNGYDVEWSEMSESFKETAALVGLDELLSLESAND